jgi:hypothetical protein
VREGEEATSTQSSNWDFALLVHPTRKGCCLLEASSNTLTDAPQH